MDSGSLNASAKIDFDAFINNFQAMMQGIDFDHDGKMSQQEYIQAAVGSGRSHPQALQNVREIWSVLDMDDDGTISYNDIVMYSQGQRKNRYARDQSGTFIENSMPRQRTMNVAYICNPYGTVDSIVELWNDINKIYNKFYNLNFRLVNIYQHNSAGMNGNIDTKAAVRRVITRDNSDIDLVVVFASSGGLAGDFNNWVNRINSLQLPVVDAEFRAHVVAHEIGHLFGLEDTSRSPPNPCTKQFYIKLSKNDLNLLGEGIGISNVLDYLVEDYDNITDMNRYESPKSITSVYGSQYQYYESINYVNDFVYLIPRRIPNRNSNDYNTIPDIMSYGAFYPEVFCPEHIETVRGVLRSLPYRNAGGFGYQGFVYTNREQLQIIGLTDEGVVNPTTVPNPGNNTGSIYSQFQLQGGKMGDLDIYINKAYDYNSYVIINNTPVEIIFVNGTWTYKDNNFVNISQQDQWIPYNGLVFSNYPIYKNGNREEYAVLVGGTFKSITWIRNNVGGGHWQKIGW